MARRGEGSGSGRFLNITLLSTYKQTSIWTASSLTKTVNVCLFIQIWHNVHHCTPVPIILRFCNVRQLVHLLYLTSI